MPNNQQEEGMLEDWIKLCIGDEKETLFKKAITVVQQLKPQKFKPHLTHLLTHNSYQSTQLPRNLYAINTVLYALKPDPDAFRAGFAIGFSSEKAA